MPRILYTTIRENTLLEISSKLVWNIWMLNALIVIGEYLDIPNSVPFTVTLCSPVPGWVNRSTWMETSPTLPSSELTVSGIISLKNISPAPRRLYERDHAEIWWRNLYAVLSIAIKIIWWNINIVHLYICYFTPFGDEIKIYKLFCWLMWK